MSVPLPLKAAALAILVGLAIMYATAEPPPDQGPRQIQPKPATYATDTMAWLSEDARARIEVTLREYEERTQHEIRLYIDRTKVNVLPVTYRIDTETGNVSQHPTHPATFGKTWFNAWEIGRQDIDDGGILFIWTDDGKAPGRGEWWFTPGHWTRIAVTDAQATRIIMTVPGPYLDKGDHDGAVEATLKAILDQIDEYERK